MTLRFVIIESFFSLYIFIYKSFVNLKVEESFNKRQRLEDF